MTYGFIPPVSQNSASGKWYILLWSLVSPNSTDKQKMTHVCMIASIPKLSLHAVNNDLCLYVRQYVQPLRSRPLSHTAIPWQLILYAVIFSEQPQLLASSRRGRKKKTLNLSYNFVYITYCLHELAHLVRAPFTSTASFTKPMMGTLSRQKVCNTLFFAPCYESRNIKCVEKFKPWPVVILSSKVN